MDNPELPVPLEQLLAHREWVRRVARALVRDVNTADDLEQDVWLEALKRPPRSGKSLRGWLLSVMRHNLIDLRRADTRRRAREEAQVRRHSCPPAEEVVAEAEVHRRIVDAVMDLAEPYRSTVLLRYFQALDSPAIAHRMGVAPETVRTRLARAMGMLRARFDLSTGGDRGAWYAALLPLAQVPDGGPMPLRPGSVATATGGVLVKASTAIAVVAGVILTGGLAWSFLRTDAGLPAPSAGNRTGEVPGGSGSSMAAPTEPASGQPGSSDPPPSPPPAPAGEGIEAPADQPGSAWGPSRDRLPRIAGLDPLPPEKDRLDVGVDARGCVTTDGTVVRVADLMNLMAERAEEIREDDAPACSRLDVVFRVDRDLPWQGAQWLMQACADPKVRVYRIHFAAASTDGASEGVLSTFLPKDTGARSPAPALSEDGSPQGPSPEAGAGTRVRIDDSVEVRVAVSLTHESSGPAVTTEDLLVHLQSKWSQVLEKKPVVEIDATPSVAVGEVLGAVDAARRWGAGDVRFRGTRVFKGDSLETTLVGLPSSGNVLAISVFGTPVPPR